MKRIIFLLLFFCSGFVHSAPSQYSVDPLCTRQKGLDLSVCQAVQAAKHNQSCDTVKKDQLALTVCRAIATITQGKSCHEEFTTTDREKFICTQLYLGMSNWRIQHLSVENEPGGRSTQEYRQAKGAFFELGKTLGNEFDFIGKRRTESLARNYFDDLTDQMSLKSELKFENKSCDTRGDGYGHTRVFSEVGKSYKYVKPVMLKSSGGWMNSAGAGAVIVRQYIAACTVSVYTGEKTENLVAEKVPPACEINSTNREAVLNLAQNLFFSISQVPGRGVPSLPELTASAAMIVNFLKANKDSYLRALKGHQEPIRLAAGAGMTVGPNQNFKLPMPLVFLPDGRVMIQLSEYLSQGKSHAIAPLGQGGFKVVYSAIDVEQAQLSPQSPARIGHDFALTSFALSEIKELAKRKSTFDSIIKEAQFHRRVANKVGQRIAEPSAVYHENQIGTALPKSLILVQRAYEGDLNKLREELYGSARQTQEGVDPDQVRLGFTQELLEALAVSHKNKIHHRDIKPGNIFYGFDKDRIPHGVIGDFGIALNIGSGKKLADEPLGGSVGYMSPEFKVLFYSVQEDIAKLNTLEARRKSIEAEWQNKPRPHKLKNQLLEGVSKESAKIEKEIKKLTLLANKDLKNDVYAMGVTLKSLWNNNGTSDTALENQQGNTATGFMDDAGKGVQGSGADSAAIAWGKTSPQLDMLKMSSLLDQMTHEDVRARLSAQQALDRIKEIHLKYTKTMRPPVGFIRGRVPSEEVFKSFEKMSIQLNQQEFKSDLKRAAQAMEFEIKSLKQGQE